MMTRTRTFKPDERKIKRRPTSIKIRPDIWKQAKIMAINQDMEVSELVEKALEEYIK
jgi:hypothetical protein